MNGPSHPRYGTAVRTVAAAAAFFVVTVSTPLGALAAATVQPSPLPGKSVGTITVTPATGTDLIAFSMTTSKACPSGGNILATLFGQGLPPEGLNIVGNSSTAIYPHTVAGGLVIPSQDNLRSRMSSLPDPQPLLGEYQVRVECRDGPKVADLGDFFGSVVFDSHHRYVAHEPNVPASSLQTVAPTVVPVPSMVGSEAPETSQSPLPARAKSGAPPRAKSSGIGSLGPWLVGFGALMGAFGVAVLIRSRRAGAANVVAR